MTKSCLIRRIQFITRFATSKSILSFSYPEAANEPFPADCSKFLHWMLGGCNYEEAGPETITKGIMFNPFSHAAVFLSELGFSFNFAYPESLPLPYSSQFNSGPHELPPWRMSACCTCRKTEVTQEWDMVQTPRANIKCQEIPSVARRTERITVFSWLLVKTMATSRFTEQPCLKGIRWKQAQCHPPASL